MFETLRLELKYCRFFICLRNISWNHRVHTINWIRLHKGIGYIEILLSKGSPEAYTNGLDSLIDRRAVGTSGGKVHIFWESHKVLRNLHFTFVLCSDSQNFAAYSEYINCTIATIDFGRSVNPIYPILKWGTLSPQHYYSPSGFLDLPSAQDRLIDTSHE